MKILILSFYYPPDLSAGSFRIIGLVNALLGLVTKNIQIEVITTQPNRYKGFEAREGNERLDCRLRIHRIKLPSHNSGMVDQAKSFIYFAHKSLKITKNEKYDFIFATSSRLMTAALGAWISKQKKIPLYLDIRDIFLDTLRDVLSKKSMFFLNPIFSLVEYWTCKQANHINLVSPGFEDYFKNKYPTQSFSYYMNGIDEEFTKNNVNLKEVNFFQKVSEAPIKILYAGNIGEGQGLHKIVPGFAKKLGARVSIKVIGAGGKLEELLYSLASMGVDNVQVIPPISRLELIREYEDADILFLHLNNYRAFEKVLPSKIFEYAAMGKPILAGVSGYASQFLIAEVSNTEIFTPCDVDGAIKAVERLSIQSAKREIFIEKYLRKNIMKNLANDMTLRFEGGE